ncbi:nucleoside-diphosphate kinase [Nocardia sp. NPDC049220]|uniref:nucleoside-diphosphate kinase n=1 Tax=Nocardia sp. NPDC049220 TaxID=3155273 RepID=UPI0034082A02
MYSGKSTPAIPGSGSEKHNPVDGEESESGRLVPNYLSTLPMKRSLYSADSYFLDSIEDLAVVAAGDSFRRFCRDHALLLLKPDAIVSRRASAVLQWVTDHGFSIVGAVPVMFTRHTVRALWQYGLNAASRDRRDTADLYMTAGECVLLLLTQAGQAEPATATLSRAKGPAEPEKCRPHHLRYAVGSFNYQLNLVHGADEPADLLRELGILCDHDQRLKLFSAAVADVDGTTDAYALVDRAQHKAPEVDLDLGRTLDEIADAAGHVEPTRMPDPAPELASLITRIRAGESRDWRQLFRLAEKYHVQITVWQRIVIATHLLDPHIPGAVSMLPDASTGVTPNATEIQRR